MVGEDYVAVGAIYEDNDGGVASGAVYVFAEGSGEMLKKIEAEDGQGADFFGNAVSVWGEHLEVGAIGSDLHGTGSGAVSVYGLPSGDLRERFAAEITVSGDGFGRSVSVREGVLVVGAHRSDEGGESSGSAMVFGLEDLEERERYRVPGG
ncbi:MAG: FG-GAP repeat protein [Verrucomicrobiales bacterium]